jgi:hypothetical protein
MTKQKTKRLYKITISFYNLDDSEAKYSTIERYEDYIKGGTKKEIVAAVDKFKREQLPKYNPTEDQARLSIYLVDLIENPGYTTEKPVGNHSMYKFDLQSPTTELITVYDRLLPVTLDMLKALSAVELESPEDRFAAAKSLGEYFRHRSMLLGIKNNLGDLIDVKVAVNLQGKIYYIHPAHNFNVEDVVDDNWVEIGWSYLIPKRGRSRGLHYYFKINDILFKLRAHIDKKTNDSKEVPPK